MTRPVPRVTLRPLAGDDADDVVRWRNLPDVHAQLFSDRPPTREEHLRWFQSLDDRRREYVIEDSVSATAIGTVGLSQIDRRHRKAEFGIVIGEPEYRGKGFAWAASQELLRLAFDELGLHRVYLRVFADNQRAIILYERLGFVREGQQRDDAFKDGRFRDVVVMGLLEEEWRRRAGR